MVLHNTNDVLLNIQNHEQCCIFSFFGHASRHNARVRGNTAGLTSLHCTHTRSQTHTHTHTHTHSSGAGEGEAWGVSYNNCLAANIKHSPPLYSDISAVEVVAANIKHSALHSDISAVEAVEADTSRDSGKAEGDEEVVCVGGSRSVGGRHADSKGVGLDQPIHRDWEVQSMYRARRLEQEERVYAICSSSATAGVPGATPHTPPHIPPAPYAEQASAYADACSSATSRTPPHMPVERCSRESKSRAPTPRKSKNSLNSSRGCSECVFKGPSDVSAHVSIRQHASAHVSMSRRCSESRSVTLWGGAGGGGYSASDTGLMDAWDCTSICIQVCVS
jgi:hypothetical protein